MEFVTDTSVSTSAQSVATTEASVQRERLDHGPFVIGAYAVALAGLALLLVWSWQSMRRAEQRRDSVKRKRTDP